MADEVLRPGAYEIWVSNAWAEVGALQKLREEGWVELEVMEQVFHPDDEHGNARPPSFLIRGMVLAGNHSDGQYRILGRRVV